MYYQIIHNLVIIILNTSEAHHSITVLCKKDELSSCIRLSISFKLFAQFKCVRPLPPIVVNIELPLLVFWKHFNYG